MMFIIAVVMVAAVVAEPPPSNSYLPPSGRSGYPQGTPAGPSFSGGPQVIAARSFDQGRGHGHAHGNDFARNNHHDHLAHGGFDHSEGYEQAAVGRNAIEPQEPANYNFEYMVSDNYEGTDFGHQEERQEDRAQGEYHVVLPDGRKQTVSYEADERGFKPRVSYQDTENLARSNGYDSNANNGHDVFQNGAHGNHGNARSNGY